VKWLLVAHSHRARRAPGDRADSHRYLNCHSSIYVKAIAAKSS
jgi:hypothetical protein